MLMINVAPGTISLTGKLAAHFCADEISADQVKDAYDRAVRILDNPTQFPKADTEYLLWLEDALYELSPTACDLGL